MIKNSLFKLFLYITTPWPWLVIALLVYLIAREPIAPEQELSFHDECMEMMTTFCKKMHKCNESFLVVECQINAFNLCEEERLVIKDEVKKCHRELQRVDLCTEGLPRECI